MDKFDFFHVLVFEPQFIKYAERTLNFTQVSTWITGLTGHQMLEGVPFCSIQGFSTFTQSKQLIKFNKL